MIVVLVVGIGVGVCVVVDGAAAATPGVVTIGTLDAEVATEVVGCEVIKRKEAHAISQPTGISHCHVSASALSHHMI